MADIAIIGGTGLRNLKTLEMLRRQMVMTPYGEPSSPLVYGKIDEHEVVFLARHGHAHNIPPHIVNYRANLWALNDVGVKNVIAINAVGSMNEAMAPGDIIIPDQIIDYTTSRVNTFYETGLSHVTHIDFTHPYTTELIDQTCRLTEQSGIVVTRGATYAATEGPRLETAAEIRRLKNDGCDIVGMTGMPEAALAREMEMNYVSICVVANWAAGLYDEKISMDVIEKNLISGMAKVRSHLSVLIPAISLE